MGYAEIKRYATDHGRWAWDDLLVLAGEIARASVSARKDARADEWDGLESR